MNVVELHSALDFARDVLVAVVAGLLLPFLLSWLAHRRNMQKRLERHATEIRHTQDKTGVKPFYPEYPADKL